MRARPSRTRSARPGPRRAGRRAGTSTRKPSSAGAAAPASEEAKRFGSPARPGDRAREAVRAAARRGPAPAPDRVRATETGEEAVRPWLLLPPPPVHRRDHVRMVLDRGGIAGLPGGV